ncbi:hypothetical protein C8Q75DRAFT_803002 [Abortiporus biennis]|nr:hypothetical protein C8Q75DRAFT_803002 [Abortiporus biennis]
MPPAKGTRSTGGSASSAKPPSGGKTTASDAARIQSTQAKAGNDTSKGSFPARAQAAAARNTGEAKAKTAKGGKAGN